MNSKHLNNSYLKFEFFPLVSVCPRIIFRCSMSVFWEIGFKYRTCVAEACPFSCFRGTPLLDMKCLQNVTAHRIRCWDDQHLEAPLRTCFAACSVSWLWCSRSASFQPVYLVYFIIFGYIYNILQFTFMLHLCSI